MDDRFTGYSAAAIEPMGFEGGKMLLRIDPDDPATVNTLGACGRAVSELSAPGLVAMVEPFLSHRVEGHIRKRAQARGHDLGHLGGCRAGRHLRVHLAEAAGGGRPVRLARLFLSVR